MRNLDVNRGAQNVTIVDTLPDGFDYQWGSLVSMATCVPGSPSYHTTPTQHLIGDDNPQPIAIRGTNPYHVEIGDLSPQASMLLTYRAVLYKK